MNPLVSPAWWAFALLALLGLDASSDDSAAKARLESALQATSLKSETSASGLSHMASFTNEENRKQNVLISRAPSSVSGLVMHSIYTNVWVDSQNPPDAATLRKVFSKTKKLGSFYLFKDSRGTWAIRFATQFDATSLPEKSKAGDELVKALEDLIRFVEIVGSETDKELNGEKDVQ